MVKSRVTDKEKSMCIEKWAYFEFQELNVGC